MLPIKTHLIRKLTADTQISNMLNGEEMKKGDIKKTIRIITNSNRHAKHAIY